MLAIQSWLEIDQQKPVPKITNKDNDFIQDIHVP